MKLLAIMLAGSLLISGAAQAKQYTIPDGTEVQLALEDPVSSEAQGSGDPVTFKVVSPILAKDGTVLIAPGARARLRWTPREARA